MKDRARLQLIGSRFVRACVFNNGWEFMVSIRIIMKIRNFALLLLVLLGSCHVAHAGHWTAKVSDDDDAPVAPLPHYGLEVAPINVTSTNINVCPDNPEFGKTYYFKWVSDNGEAPGLCLGQHVFAWEATNAASSIGVAGNYNWVISQCWQTQGLDSPFKNAPDPDFVYQLTQAVATDGQMTDRDTKSGANVQRYLSLDPQGSRKLKLTTDLDVNNYGSGHGVNPVHAATGKTKITNIDVEVVVQ